MLSKLVSGVNTGMGRTREQRVLLMVVTMVICFLLCWLPYGIVALLATFGKPGLITPEASIIPSLLAKTSTVVNPIIYIFMNKQFYRCFQAFLTCHKPSFISSFRSISKATKLGRKSRTVDPNNITVAVASMGRPSIFIQNRTDSNGEQGLSVEGSKPVVSLVAHYNG